MDMSYTRLQHQQRYGAFDAYIKEEPGQERVHALPRGEAESDSMTSASPVSDSDALSFPAATAMLLAPPALLDGEQELFFRLAMDDDMSSDSHDSIKTESDGGAASSSSHSHPQLASGGGSRRAMTPEERRKRRNMKERERVQGVKDRIENLRRDLAELQLKHDAFKKELEQRVIVRASSDDDIQALVTSYLSQPGATLDTRDAEQLRQYLLLKKETEQLQFLKRSLEDQLKPRVSESNAIKAALDASSPLALEEIDHSESLRAPNSTGRSSASPSTTAITKTTTTNDDDDDPLDVVPPIRMDAVSLFEAMLAEDPLTPEEARAFVEGTCREMMEGLTRSDWIEGFEGFGWRGSRRLDDKSDGSVLQFRLSQQFPSVSASQLVQKTWNMLTNVDEYRRIQPHTQQLRVIQRVNDECWVIALAVGKERPRLGHLLVARAIIHGGYLITFRTLPLLRKGSGGSELARQKFVENETGGRHVNVHSWYNFQERPNASGGVDCEVIFGGSGRNGDRLYLKQLQMEVVAGITRWQSAVGFSNFIFSSALTGSNETAGGDAVVPHQDTSSAG